MNLQNETYFSEKEKKEIQTFNSKEFRFNLPTKVAIIRFSWVYFICLWNKTSCKQSLCISRSKKYTHSLTHCACGRAFFLICSFKLYFFTFDQVPRVNSVKNTFAKSTCRKYMRQRKSLALANYIGERMCVYKTLVICSCSHLLWLWRGKNATYVGWFFFALNVRKAQTHTFICSTMRTEAIHEVCTFAYSHGNLYSFRFVRWTTVFYSLTTNRQPSTVVIITIIYDNKYMCCGDERNCCCCSTNQNQSLNSLHSIWFSLVLLKQNNQKSHILQPHTNWNWSEILWIVPSNVHFTTTVST